MSCRVTRGHWRVNADTASAKARGDFARKVEQQRAGVPAASGFECRVCRRKSVEAARWPSAAAWWPADELLGMDFIERSQNVLFLGQRGVGKTMLAQNLGLAALEKGHTVRFTTLAGVLADLLKQKSLPAFERRLRRHVSPELLIIDELG